MKHIFAGALLAALVAAEAPAQETPRPAATPAIPLRGLALSDGLTDGSYDSAAVDVPAKLVTPGPRQYPPNLERARVGGTVLFQFVIDTLGRVDITSVLALQSTNGQLQAAALAMLLGSRFTPAMKDGHKVPMRTRQVITFRP